MKNIRLIARLDIKSEYLVKGIQLEGLRKLGNPNDFSKRYYEQGIDEIIYMDIVASLYDRNSLLHIIKSATKNIFIPLTVGGGIRSTDNVRDALQAGADKVAINTAAIKKPKLISDVANYFGSQCMVLSIEAKKNFHNKWEVYFDNGREKTGKDVLEWAKKGEDLGAGEILLTSVDNEGGQKGMDIELIKAVTNSVSIPVIASGGVGSIEHISEAINHSNVDAIAMAHVLHHDTCNLSQIHQWAVKQDKLEIRS